MIFTRLIMNNFKSYKYADIPLDKGISVIVGENGAGKSTIFEAISFALFKEHTSSKLNELVRNNSNEKMSVELEFTSGGNTFKVIREKLSSIKSTLLRKSNENNSFVPVCAGDKEVANEIQNILDLDKKLFLNAVYVRQGEISQLVDKSPAEKKQLIGKLLGIDSLEKSWNSLMPIITEYENEKAELKGILNNSDDIENKFEEKVLIKNDLKNKGLDLEKKIKEIKELKNSINQDLINMEREKDIFENFTNNMEIQLNNKKNLNQQRKVFVEQLNKIEEALIEIDNLQKYVDKLPIYLCFNDSIERYQQLQKELNRLNSTLELISTQKNIISQKEMVSIKYINLEEEIDSLNEEKVETEKQLAVISQLASEKKDIINNISSLRNKLATFIKSTKNKLAEEGVSSSLLSDLNSVEKLSEIVEQHINKLKQTIDFVDSKISTLNEEKAKLLHIVDESKSTLEELQSVGSTCPICQSEITTKKRLDLNNHYNSIVSLNSKEIANIVEEVNELTSKKEKLNAKLNIFEGILNTIHDFNYELKSLNDLSVKLNQIDTQINEMGVDNNDLGELILKIKKSENKLNSIKEDYEEYNDAIASLKVLPDERSIKEEIDNINKLIDEETIKLDKAIQLDDFLTKDINHEDLSIKINDLKEKEEEYVKLKGSVSNKDEIELNIISIDKELNIIKNKISDIQNGLDSSTFDEEKHIELKNMVENYESQYEELNNELRDIKGQGKVLLPLIADLKEQITMNKVYKQQHENLNDYIHLLNIIRDLYGKNGIQRDLRSRSRPLIQYHAKKFFSQFNFDYSDLIIDEDYNVSVIGPEGESSLDMVSGGEKIAIAISLRLGITQALNKGNSDTILLDEPTIFLDSARRDELINLIKDMTLLPQMIIVTHEPQLESAADNLIKVEKVNGISKVTYSQ